MDPEDEDSYAMTAIRETFEESGLLLASHKSASSAPPQLDEAALDNARTAILKQETTFKQFLSDNNLTADIDQLLPFTQWVTPPMVPTSVQFTILALKEKPKMLDTAASTPTSSSPSSLHPHPQASPPAPKNNSSQHQIAAVGAAAAKKSYPRALSIHSTPYPSSQRAKSHSCRPSSTFCIRFQISYMARRIPTISVHE